MTAAALHLPLAAGGAVLELTGNAIHWGFARYMRAPLANTAILAMLTLTAMAASNALYNQRHHHPSPLFAPFSRVEAPDVQPVIPATRPKKKPVQSLAPLPSETTGSVAKPAVITLGNAEVTEIQRKLHSMQIYEGTIDGLYGPRTARAIKAFEQRVGLQPKGELTVALLEAVRGASVIAPEPTAEPLPTPDPLPEVTLPKVQVTPKVAVVQPVEEPKPEAAVTFEARAAAPLAAKELTPLAQPAPLVTSVEAKPEVVARKPMLRRELPETPQEAMDLVAKTAGEAIDTIIDGVQTVTMTTQGKKKLPEPAAFVAEPTAEPARIVDASAPQVGVPLPMPVEETTQSSADVAVLDTDAKPEDLMPAFSVTDPIIVAKVQRGLASLGFLQGAADGVAGEATATAIRRFEVWYNYDVTGRISPELLDLLVANGAVI